MSEEKLTLGRAAKSEPGGKRTPGFVTALLLLAVAAAAVISSGSYRHELSAVDLSRPALAVLVLGDTSATRTTCTGCTTYIDQLGVALASSSRRQVQLDDQTEVPTAPPSSMPATVERLRHDRQLQALVASADVIVVAIGTGNVTRPTTSPLCRSPREDVCPLVTIPSFRQAMVDALAEIEILRNQRQVALNVVTPPPTSGLPAQGDTARTACQITVAHRGACINVYALARTDHYLSADDADPLHPELTQHAHDVIAQSLITAARD